MPNAPSDSTGDVDAGPEIIVFGWRTYIAWSTSRDVYVYHSGSHVSKKLDRSLPWEVPLALGVVADNEPVLDSKPNTSSRQWGTRSASNPPGPMFFGLARVSDAPAVSWSPDSVNHSTVEPAV